MTDGNRRLIPIGNVTLPARTARTCLTRWPRCSGAFLTQVQLRSPANTTTSWQREAASDSRRERRPLQRGVVGISGGCPANGARRQVGRRGGRQRSSIAVSTRHEGAVMAETKAGKGAGVCIGGYKPAAASFQSILTGYHQNGELMFAGKVRQGVNPASRAPFADNAPVSNTQMSICQSTDEQEKPFRRGNHSWGNERTVLVGTEARRANHFTEWTNYGLLRHAS
jgi:hypothetical protein